MITASSLAPFDEAIVIEPEKRQAVTVEFFPPAIPAVLGKLVANSQKPSPASSSDGGPNELRDEPILEILAENRSPALIGVVSQSSVGKENPQLRFVLNNYCQKTVIFTGSQSYTEDQRAHNALLQRAKFMAFLASRPSLAIAEEALSRTFKEIGESNLASKFKVGQSGLKAYVNRIIQRKVQEYLTELRRQRADPLAVEPVARDVDPSRAMELNELPYQCDQRLAKGVSKPRVSKVAKAGSSTVDVRKHRERERKWKQVEDLFPGMRLRPRKRNVG